MTHRRPDPWEEFFAWLGREIAAWLEPYRPPPKPRPFTFTFTKVTHMPKYDVTVSLPALPADATEVASQQLTLTVNGADQPPLTPALTDTSVDLGGTFSAGDALSASLIYLNPSGVPSPARVETTTVSDTTVPPEPGDFGFSMTVVPGS